MNIKTFVLKELEGFRLNVMLGLDVDYDVYQEKDILKALSKADKKFVEKRK